MVWKKFTIFTTTAAEDLVSLMLNEYGVGGVEIENNVPLSASDAGEMFIDILPETAPDDGSSKLSFYLRLSDENDNIEPEEEETRGTFVVDGAGGSSEGTAGAARDMAASGSQDMIGGGAGGRSGSADVSDDSYSIHDKIWTDEEIDELLRNIRSDLDAMRDFIDIGEGRVEEGVTEDTDWRDNWKRFFKPVKVSGFYIKPSWEKDAGPDESESPKEKSHDVSMSGEDREDSEGGENGPDRSESERVVINIDPGTAFGTGSHETTRLCLKALEKYLRPGDAVLDIGTGSGILGIAALKKGAAFVTATDLDEMCRPSIETNLAGNDISGSYFKFYIGNILTDQEFLGKIKGACPRGYDLIMANILAPVIKGLAAKGCVDSLIKPGGVFICSGILDEKLSDVIDAFTANRSWEIVETAESGEWRSVVVKRTRD